MIETTWMSESSIIARNKVFDFKTMQWFMKKINAWAYVAYLGGTYM